MKDGEDVRLDNLRDSVRETMLNGGWWTLKELEAAIGRGSATGISAKLRDLRKLRYGSYTVESRHIGDGVWQYRLLKTKPTAPPAPSGAQLELL